MSWSSPWLPYGVEWYWRERFIVNLISVDARGNRIPIQGYPQSGFGLASAVVFTILAFGIAMLGMSRRRRLN